jgi:hypothetical protein
MNHPIKSLLHSSAVLVTLFVASAAQAQVTLINDSFNDGGRTDGADPLDAQWHLISSNAVTASTAFNRLTLTSTDAGITHPHAITHFTPTSLGVGETLALSFDFNSIKTSANNNNRIRFGFYNSAGTQQNSDLLSTDVGTLYQDDLGYSVWAPRNITGSPVALYARNTDATANTTPISLTANTAIPGATTNAVEDTSAPTFSASASLSMTRTILGYDYTVNYGATSFSGSITTVTTFSFDMLDIWSINDINSGNSFAIDNVLLSYTAIPEPSAFAVLAGLATLAACVARRRIRR